MWKLVNRSKLSNHKSNCVIPLVKTFQWPPIAIRIKSKVLTVACKGLLAPSNSLTSFPFSLSLSLFIFQNSPAKVAFFLSLLCAKLLPITGALYPMFLLLEIFFFQNFALHENSNVSVLLTRPMPSTILSTCPMIVNEWMINIIPRPTPCLWQTHRSPSITLQQKTHCPAARSVISGQPPAVSLLRVCFSSPVKDTQSSLGISGTLVPRPLFPHPRCIQKSADVQVPYSRPSLSTGSTSTDSTTHGSSSIFHPMQDSSNNFVPEVPDWVGRDFVKSASQCEECSWPILLPFFSLHRCYSLVNNLQSKLHLSVCFLENPTSAVSNSKNHS